MAKKSKSQIVRLGYLVNGQLIAGTVTFSPAPPPGILAELAKYEARRMLDHVIEEEVAAGHL